MEYPIRTNRLAVISFISGITAIFFIVIPFVVYNSTQTAEFVTRITDGVILPIRNLCVIATFMTGILALKDIKKTGGTKISKIFSWFGIVIGAGWIFFGSIVGITFLVAEILH